MKTKKLKYLEKYNSSYRNAEKSKRIFSEFIRH